MDTHGTGASFDLKLIPQFDGSHGQSVVEWLQTVELICKLQKVEDVASLIPLRLIGGALAVYLQLSDKERGSVEKLKASLLAAFAVDPFVAYEQFNERNLRANELPDVFLADLRRLASIFGGVPEKALACAFVSGLPDNVRQLLRASARMEDLSLNQILTRARAIITDEQPARITDACLTTRDSEAKQRIGASTLRCYACSEQNHFARDCGAQQRCPAASQWNVGQDPRPPPRNRGRRRSGIAASSYQGNEDGKQTSAYFPSAH
ncbi:hypothetical protein M514_18334 [Trichuris suis]|uniref:CCHC-type domain-containing protein n=1 Tax=Trichuris suis TaxID=68888 RepID=A0A085NJ16_9BILA|nr:hypothetical protein M514_18334 [Trichuris suis]